MGVITMISNIASRITDLLIQNHIIQKIEADIYQYGTEMILSSLINVAIVVITGVVFHELFAAFLFFVIFAWIRSNSGGYHADTYLKCNTIFAIDLFWVLFLSKYTSPYYNLFGHTLLLLFYFFIIIRYAPVENINKPLTLCQKNICRRKCIIYGGMLAFISYFLWGVLHQEKYAVLIATTLFSVAVSIAFLVLQKGGEENEKGNSDVNG